MLIHWSYGTPKDAEKTLLLNALGVPDTCYDPAFPLPNMKPSTESEFWGWQRSYSPRASLYLGSKQIAYEWATVLAYWMGQVHPSFAVAVFNSYPKPNRVLYWTWTACIHDFKVVDSGNCWRDYACTKCPAKFHEDSSG